MKDGSKTADDRALIRVIKFSSGIGLGTMASILYSVKRVGSQLEYRLSWGTPLAFLFAVALSWVFWRVVFGRSNDLNPGLSRARKRWLAFLSLILTAATLFPFAYAFQTVTSDAAREMVQGTALAFLAVSGLGFLLWRLARFLEEDTRRNAGPHKPDSAD